MSASNNYFRHNLKHMRDVWGMSQAEMVELVCIDGAKYAAIESGAAEPLLGDFVYICDRLGLDYHVMLSELNKEGE